MHVQTDIIIGSNIIKDLSRYINEYLTPVAESALRFDKKVPQGNFFRSYTLSREADLLVHTADLISTI